MFDEMQEFVYGMMEFDSYRKFLASAEFKAWQGMRSPFFIDCE